MSNKYEIPRDFDQEWMADMLRKLAENLECIQDALPDNEVVDDCVKIVEAFRSYAGY